jgi:hypothetical protein
MVQLWFDPDQPDVDIKLAHLKTVSNPKTVIENAQHYFKKLGDSPANLLINQGVMATLQERRLGYHSRAGFEPGTSGFSTLRINHYAARGIYFKDPNIKVFLSPVKNKKYAVYDPIHKKLISFGNINYEDYSFHLDDRRRDNYLKRASNIRGNWRNNPYSPNNLAINLLW